MLLAWIISVLSDCNLTITPHKNPYSSRLWPLFRATLFLKVQLCHNWIKIHQSLSVMDIFIESVVCNGSGLYFECHSYNKCCTNLTSRRWCFGHTRGNTLKTTFPVYWFDTWTILPNWSLRFHWIFTAVESIIIAVQGVFRQITQWLQLTIDRQLSPRIFYRPD